MSDTARRDTRVGAILDDYLRALEKGNAPDRETLLERHPDLAEELRGALRGLDLVRGLAAEGEPARAGIGGSIGDFRLLRELGRGGMAVVYEAEQVSLGRRVALKVLPFAAVLDSKQLQRFRNEALAAAHLHHPHIVPVHGVGSERGVHYYAMQYIEGQSLAHAIADMKRGGAGEGTRTPISSHGSHRETAYIRMAAALGVQAAEALDHAHEMGIVHRDVKPGNLLVDFAGKLWITDFGLARSHLDVGLTMTGEIVGTIRYMSPEQALAKRVPVDHRTDVYSLGTTLYELFTLEAAFPGDDPHVVIQDIAARDPVPPRRLNPALPVDLETVILKAMSKDPASRYATAQEMAQDLKRFLEDRPVEAKRPGMFRRAVKWSRRHKAVVGAATVALLLTVAGLAAGTALLWREKRRTDVAFGRAEGNLDLALRALDEVYVQEAKGHPRLREGLPRDLLQRGLRFYEEFAGANAENPEVERLTGNAYHTASMILRELGEEEKAAEALDRAIAAYRNTIRRFPGDTRHHNNLGMALASKGDAEAAIRECREAIRLDPRNAIAYHNLSHGLAGRGDFDGAIEALREAVRLDPDDAGNHFCLGTRLSEARDPDGAIREFVETLRLEPGHAGAHGHLGSELSARGDRDGAVREWREAVRLLPDDAEAHDSLGAALSNSGDLDGAIREFREAVRLGPHDARAHYNLGTALSKSGDPGGAIREFREAVRLKPDFAAARTNLGLDLLERGDVGGAIEELGEAVRLGPDDAAGHYNLGTALRERDLDAAIREFGEAVRLRPDFAIAHNNLGIALWNGRHDADGAIRELREAIRLQPDLASAHMALGVVLGATGDAKGAIRAHREAVHLAPRWADARCALGDALIQQGDPRGALAEYRQAFSESPALAEDPECGYRYNAACAAALVAARGGPDAEELRGLALEWLRADLAAREGAGLSATLADWRKDGDLEAVRDRIDRLPEAERARWAGLWAGVDRAIAGPKPAK